MVGAVNLKISRKIKREHGSGAQTGPYRFWAETHPADQRHCWYVTDALGMERERAKDAIRTQAQGWYRKFKGGIIKMVKTIVAVVIALVLLNTVWFVLKIAVLIWTEAKEEKKWRMGPVYQSEAREAFIMECSQKDIKGNPYAERLDKCIKKMDREEKHLKKARERSKQKLSKMRERV